MAIDPVCGMTVDESTTRKAEQDGQTFYFCSEHCRQKFLSSKPPQQHAHDLPHDHHTAAAGPKLAVETGKYVCPMHPEVVSDKPGNCPKCGMALEPARPQAAKQ